MKALHTCKKFVGITVVTAAALLGAAPTFASVPTITDPIGPNSGIGRVLAGVPTIVDPSGPNSGMGRFVAAFPTTADPQGPNSGMGRDPVTGEPASGVGRSRV